jgi:diadenosine tetraphosphate (Ap4A) HIT family hydrolase
MKNFSQIPKDRIIYQNEYFFIIEDAFPVSPGKLLIISNAIISDYFELNQSEMDHLSKVIITAKSIIESNYQPDGYNIGMNCGETARQTVIHFHCHLYGKSEGKVCDTN